MSSKTEKGGKFRNVHCRTWNIARKLKVMENEKFPLDVKMDVNAPYGLAVILGTEEFYQTESSLFMMQKISQCARYVLVSKLSEKWKQLVPFLKVIDLQVENDRYYLLDLGGI